MKFLLIVLSCLSSTVALANQCSLQLQQDLTVSPAQISLQQGQQELWRMDTKGQLWQNGQKVTLSSTDQLVLKQYQQQLRSQVTASAALMDDSLQFARAVLDQNLQQSTGQGLADHPQLQTVVRQLEQQLKQLVERKDSSIYVYGSQLASANSNLAQEAEQKIQQAMLKISSQMMLTLGQQALQGNGTAAEKMQRFSNGVGQFGSRLKADLKSASGPLQQRGQHICQQLQQLDQVEMQLQRQIPQLADLDLIDSTAPGFKSNLEGVL
ncbi:DUF2884 family protein [Rheinheimera sp.]|uniref:DUF2884 family protein n=1 Tax=Rheinheimera sp. TaxID=1869214 RepID=UPI00307D5D44